MFFVHTPNANGGLHNGCSDKSYETFDMISTLGEYTLAAGYEFDPYQQLFQRVKKELQGLLLQCDGQQL